MAKMFFALFHLPEWQGDKAHDMRPCIVRRRNGEKAEVIPCSSQLRADGSVFVGNLKRPSFAVMQERRVVPIREIELLDELPSSLSDEVLYWEFTHAINLLSPKELAHCKQDLTFA